MMRLIMIALVFTGPVIAGSVSVDSLVGPRDVVPATKYGDLAASEPRALQIEAGIHTPAHIDNQRG